MSSERCLVRSDRGTAWTESFAPSFVFSLMVALGILLVRAPAYASADDFPAPLASAKVIARLPISGGGIQKMFLRQDGRNCYLYLQRAFQGDFTVVDVTRPEQPNVVSRKPIETVTVIASGAMSTVTPREPATVDADIHPDAVANQLPVSLHVLKVSDLAHSESLFSGRAAIVFRDPARNLTYVADDEGVWILAGKRTMHKPHVKSVLR